MAYISCFDVLKDIACDADEIRFSNDARLKELFEMTVAGDHNRLENAEAKYRDALSNHEQLKLEVQRQRNELLLAREDLKEIEEKCERLKNKNSAPKTKMTENALKKLHQEIKDMMNILKMYKEFTGVRFEFVDTPQAIVGCVVVKGTAPLKSVLRPFCIKKPYSHVVEDIWAEISAATDEEI